MQNLNKKRNNYQSTLETVAKILGASIVTGSLLIASGLFWVGLFWLLYSLFLLCV